MRLLQSKKVGGSGNESVGVASGLLPVLWYLVEMEGGDGKTSGVVLSGTLLFGTGLLLLGDGDADGFKVVVAFGVKGLLLLLMIELLNIELELN